MTFSSARTHAASLSLLATPESNHPFIMAPPMLPAPNIATDACTVLASNPGWLLPCEGCALTAGKAAEERQRWWWVQGQYGGVVRSVATACLLAAAALCGRSAR